MPLRIAVTVVILLLACCVPVGTAADRPSERRVDVHLFGGDLAAGAPLASWYRSIGITDVWLYPLQGAFPQDQRPESQKNVEELTREGTLESYRTQAIRYWWFERPVPDYFYLTAKSKESPAAHLWDSRPETDAIWAQGCRRIGEIYPAARRAGFAGIVYDNESYYSFQGDEAGRQKPWVWGGHEQEYGSSGNYYRRGRQVGQAIHEVWPDARVIMVYAFGYAGERWWYQGVQDGGVTVLLGPEHTYGAGPGELGAGPDQRWWGGMKTKATCDWKRTQFPWIRSNQQLIAGLFPVDFGAQKPNYRARYFREQLHSAATEDSAPIAVWLWPQGPFTPESWQAVRYADGETADDYLQVLREFSTAFTRPSP